MSNLNFWIKKRTLDRICLLNKMKKTKKTIKITSQFLILGLNNNNCNKSTLKNRKVSFNFNNNLLTFSKSISKSTLQQTRNCISKKKS